MKFPARTGDPVMFRTYLRKKQADNSLESPDEAISRSLQGSDGKLLTPEERKLCLDYGLKLYSLPSGRRLWYGGTDGSEQPENIPGLYNCNSLDPRSLGMEIFRQCFENLMLGCGVGVVVEKDAIASLPLVTNKIEVMISKSLSSNGWNGWNEAKATEFTYAPKEVWEVTIIVGDSRKGWIDAYMLILSLATSVKVADNPIKINIAIQPRNRSNCRNFFYWFI